MKRLDIRLALLAVPLAIACGDKDPEDTSGGDDTEVTDTQDTGDTEDTADTGYAFATDEPSAYARVDRMGMPAVSTALIVSKDDYNQANPNDDLALAFAGEIIGSLAGLHGALDDDLTALGLTPCTVVGDGSGTCVQQGGPLIIPDTLKIDVNGPAGFPNGRGPADPVMDVTLAVVLLDLSVHPADLLASLPLNPPANDVAFASEFPYLAAPH